MNTGDIVEQRGPDCLVWIDRAKNVLKLSQGEFVATSRLEGLYVSRSPFIRQMYVYGNGLRSYLLAVVVPDMEPSSAHLGERGDEVDEAAMKQLVRSEINRIAADEGLHGYEIPRDFVVELVPFTTENGLLTASNKPSRPKLRARYGERLEALYASIERAQVAELEGLRRDRVSALVDDRQGEEGRRGHARSRRSRRRASGAELHSARRRLARRRRPRRISSTRSPAVDVPVGLLLDPTSSVRASRAPSTTRSGHIAARNATFDEIHGAESDDRSRLGSRAREVPERRGDRGRRARSTGVGAPAGGRGRASHRRERLPR